MIRNTLSASSAVQRCIALSQLKPDNLPEREWPLEFERLVWVELTSA